MHNFCHSYGGIILFARNSFSEYMEGHTAFYISTRPFTVDDMPTVTICVKADETIDYKKKLVVEARIPFTKSVARLQYGSNQIDGQVIYMKKLNIFPSETLSTLHPCCVSIRTKFTEEFYKKAVGLHRLRNNFFLYSVFKIHLSNPTEKNPNQNGVLSKGEIYLTSEENSLGVIVDRWYDGNADPFNLQISQFHALMVTRTRQYQYLKGECSNETFFQCVASNLAKNRICNVNGFPCAPYSLPQKDFLNEFPMCPEKIGLDCYQEFSELTWPVCRRQKSCSVTEYSLDEYTSFPQGEMVTSWIENYGFEGGFKKTMGNSLQFSLCIDHINWQKGDREKELKVEINEEYLLWSVTTLVGNVGGVMSMTIGFSFFGYIGMWLDVIPSILRFGKNILSKLRRF